MAANHPSTTKFMEGVMKYVLCGAIGFTFAAICDLTGIERSGVAYWSSLIGIIVIASVLYDGVTK